MAKPTELGPSLLILKRDPGALTALSYRPAALGGNQPLAPPSPGCGKSYSREAAAKGGFKRCRPAGKAAGEEEGKACGSPLRGRRPVLERPDIAREQLHLHTS